MNVKDIAEKHVSLLKSFVEAHSNHDQDGIRNCLKDNVVWHTPPSFGMGDIIGKESVIDLMFATAAEYYKMETMKFDVRFILVDETYGAIQLTMTCQTVSGGDYSNIYVLTFRFEDGLIAEAWENMDTLKLTNSLNIE